MKPVTQAEFAALKGVSAQAVGQAIRDGRLDKCLVYEKGKSKPRINPVIAAKEWEQNTDHSKRTVGADLRVKAPTTAEGLDAEGSKGGNVLYQSRVMYEAFRARTAKLEYEKAAAKLVEADQVKNAWVKIVTDAKTKIMSIPSKAKANIPHLTTADVATIERLVREALEDISASTSSSITGDDDADD